MKKWNIEQKGISWASLAGRYLASGGYSLFPFVQCLLILHNLALKVIAIQTFSQSQITVISLLQQ